MYDDELRGGSVVSSVREDDLSLEFATRINETTSNEIAFRAALKFRQRFLGVVTLVVSYQTICAEAK